MEYLRAIGYIWICFNLINYLNNNFLPKGLKDIWNSITNGTVKAWRIAHPCLFALTFLEPKNWWKHLLLVTTIEVSVYVSRALINRLYLKM